jgi:RNA polymerase sigma factor (sigma-70 family)
MTATSDEPALLLAFLAGDAAAFAQIYDRHERHCFDFVRRLLAPADEATAEDVHQEVWLAVARAAASFDASKARFVTWLFTIARNKVMDHFRRTGGEAALTVTLTVDADNEDDESPLNDLVDAHAVTPEHVAHNRQLAAALLREVQALPFVQRETFVLFAQQDLSLEEVAHITQVGIETAKSRLRYARAALRANLASWRLQHA